MFCTKCGAVVLEGERFCLRCGAELPFNSEEQETARENPVWEKDAPYVTYVTDSDKEPTGEMSFSDAMKESFGSFRDKFKSADEKRRETRAKRAEDRAASREKNIDSKSRTDYSGEKRVNGALIRTCLIVLLIAAVSQMFGYVMGSVNGSLDPDEGVFGMYGSLFSCGGRTSDETEQISSSDSIVSAADSIIDEEAETTTTAETATTTAAATTVTTVSSSVKDAAHIRDLLVSRTWTTSLEGYNADVNFNKDGAAEITVRVLFVTKKVGAKYYVGDDCKFVIQAEYEGNNLGISGNITAKSDNEIIVERDGGKGTVTLKAK